MISKRVLVVGPPLSRSGGIGTLFQYAQPHFESNVKFLDTRGLWVEPRFSVLNVLQVLMQIIGAYLLRSVSLIHVNMGVAGSFARKRIVILIASFLRIPVVVQIHASSFDIWLQSKSNIQRRRVAQTLNRVQEVLVLGEYWRRVLIDAGVGPDLVKVFVMGVPDFYDASLKKSGGPLKALFAGELGIRKGLDILLEGAAQIDSDKRPKLIIAGRGNLSFWRAECNRLELNNSASFVGEIHPVEIRNLLGDVDILVLPSRAEGLPVSVLEGFSAGLAVIATKVGSLEEFAEHRTSIYFLNNCSSFDVANAFCDLLSEDLRNELSRGARALWQAKFDVRRTTSELEETWQRASQKARSK